MKKFVTILLMFLFGISVYAESVNLNEVKISGTDNEYFSAYLTHTFSIENTTGKEITNMYWSLSLPLNDGDENIVAENKGSSYFNIPQIENSEIYNINDNGEILGILSFSGEIETEIFNIETPILIDFKPIIKEVNILKKESNAPLYSYNLYYTVEYYGCKKLTISVQEDYNSLLMTSYITDYPVANIITEKIASNYYAWLDIIAKNEYGETVYTVELPPLDSSTGIIETNLDKLPLYLTLNENSLTLNGDISSITEIFIYDIIGKQIMKVDNKQNIDISQLAKGFYVLTCFDNKQKKYPIKFSK